MNKINWFVSCPNCKFMKKFEEHVEVGFRTMCDLLKGNCPVCSYWAEVKGTVELEKLDENTILATCKKCEKTFVITNLKNVDEKYFYKNYAWMYIVPVCPECGSGCRIFPLTGCMSLEEVG